MSIDPETLKTILIGLGIGIGPITIIVLILLFCPEKIEKWSVLLWKVVYCCCKKGSDKIVKHDIQGRINEFARYLESEMKELRLHGLELEWIKETETEEQFLKNNRVVIRMRNHRNQNRNFVNATMMYLGKSFLHKTKKYLAKYQRESVDIFVGKKLFEKEKPDIVDHFFDEYFGSKITDDKRIAELIEKYEIIDKVGMFFPVLIQELVFLGEKVFFKVNRDIIITEVKSLIDFLFGYSQREVGEEIQTEFEGTYCRCGIMIVAKWFKREKGDTQPYVNHIKSLLEKDIEDFYIVGPTKDNNKSFVDEVVYDIMTTLSMRKYTAKTFNAKIMIGGERTPVNNYLVMLRATQRKRYYDEESIDKSRNKDKGETVDTN